MVVLINPLNRLFVVGRNEHKAQRAAEEVASVLPRRSLHYYKDHIIPIVCDHSSFDSVRKFSVILRRKLDETYRSETFGRCNGIDVLCLNAATLQPKEVPAQFTNDDVEVTFQTNHLSPFLLMNLIHSMLNPGSRVVVTTSGLFLMQKLELDGIPVDPATGRAFRAQFEMANGMEYNCKSSYAFSKLCNVAMAIELHELLQPRGISVSCFSPGLITQTGLFRHHRDYLPFKRTRDLMKNEKSVLWGAGALVFMATSKKVASRGGTFWQDQVSGKGSGAVYGRDFGPHDVSDMHISNSGRERLWELSCDLAGIPYDMIPSTKSLTASSSRQSLLKRSES